MRSESLEHVDSLDCWCLPFVERCHCNEGHVVVVHRSGRWPASALTCEDGHP